MPLLCQIIINGETRYLSDGPVDIGALYPGAPVPQVYLPRVVSVDEVHYAADSPHGGYVRCQYGRLHLLHSVFADRIGDWPPPTICPCALWYTATPAQLLFEGSAQIEQVTPEAITYALYPSDEYATEVEEVEYTGTLSAIFTTACTTLGLTLDSTAARSPSPAISYVAKGKRLLLDNLDDMARFVCHRFWIEGATLYLVDCYADNGTTLELQSKDVLASSYTYRPPARKYSADYTQPYMRNLQMVIRETDSAAGTCLVAELRVSKSVGATMAAPAAAVASSTASGYAVANLRDANTATLWANDVATNPVGGTGQVYLQWAVTTGTIAEYQITARNSATTQAPALWDLYGFHENTLKYQLLGQVESDDWGALEARTFAVPTDVNWPVELAGSARYGNEYRVTPSCHRGYATIRSYLAQIKDIMERPQVELALLLPDQEYTTALATVPKLGQRIWLYDTSMDTTTNLWMRVAEITYDMRNRRCVVRGDGQIAAAESELGTPAIALYRFEPGALTTDSIGTADLTTTGSIVSDAAWFREGTGAASLQQADTQYFSVADASLPATMPFKSGTTNRTLTLSLRFRFAAGSIGSAVTLCSKYSSGGFSVVKNGSEQIVVTVYDTTTRTVTLPAADFRAGVWYHLGLVISGWTNLLPETGVDMFTSAAFSRTAAGTYDGATVVRVESLGTVGLPTSELPGAWPGGTLHFRVFYRREAFVSKSLTFLIRNNSTATNLSVIGEGQSSTISAYGTATNTPVGDGWNEVVITVDSGLSAGDTVRVYFGSGSSMDAGEVWYLASPVVRVSGPPVFGTDNKQLGVCVWNEDRHNWLIAPTTDVFGNTSDLAVTNAALYFGGTSARMYGWFDEAAIFAEALSLYELVVLRERTYADMYVL